MYICTMEVQNKSGVYILFATDTKEIYVGSSKNLRRRMIVHKSNFKKNNKEKGCTQLMGKNVQFIALEYTQDYTQREQWWIETFRKLESYKLVNVFDADRKNSNVTSNFRNKMSKIRKEKWKDPEYRKHILSKSEATRFTPERLNKPLILFSKDGQRYIRTCASAKEAAELYDFSKVSVAAAARGKYRNKHIYKDIIWIYEEVLYKLDELLETHHELRAISSEAWECYKSTKNVQRLTSEQAKQ